MSNEQAHELLAKRINDLCKEKVIIKHRRASLYRIAKNAGMLPQTLNNFMNGNYKDIRFSTIMKICDGLDISVKEFFNDELFDKKENTDKVESNS